MKEWHRTVILVVLIIVGVLFLLWTHYSYEQQFIQSL